MTNYYIKPKLWDWVKELDYFENGLYGELGGEDD
jgi:hypothetical protein